METKELVKTALQQSYGLVMPLLQDLQTAALVAPTSRGGNHAHWILGHLVQSEGEFRAMMRGIPNPVTDIRELFGGGTIPRVDGVGYPSYAELLTRIHNLRAETMNWLDSLEEADLDRASQAIPPGFESFFGTWRQCLLMQALHWMNHRGQLADCRRAAGREKLMA